MSVLTLPQEKKQLLKNIGLPAKPLDFENCRETPAQDFFNKHYLKSTKWAGCLSGRILPLGKTDKVGLSSCVRSAPNIKFLFRWQIFTAQAEKNIFLSYPQSLGTRQYYAGQYAIGPPV